MALSDARRLLAIFSVGATARDVNRLVDAVAALAARRRGVVEQGSMRNAAEMDCDAEHPQDRLPAHRPGDSLMADLPRLMPTRAEGETFGGVTYHIDGELVPVLTIDVSHTPVYFEHHILLWKHPAVRIGLKAMRGLLRRMVAGMQVFVTEASGPGMIAFSRDGPGHIVPVHLPQGRELEVREHQFLAATDAIDYSFSRVRGISNMLFGGTGFFIDKFHSHKGDGILWLHGYGNVFEKTLAPGESIDIEHGGWLYKDTSVRMDTVVDRLTSGVFGANMNFILNRFTGPGRVGIQSMYVHFATET